MKVTKAIIPAAGLGTRMQPISSIIPKPLLPILTETVIDNVLKEIYNAGIRSAYIIIRSEDDILKEYLDSRTSLNFPLELIFIVQEIPLGLGAAIQMAINFFKPGEHLLIVLPDNVILGLENVSRLLIQAYELHQKPICSMELVSQDEIHLRASLKTLKLSSTLLRIIDIVDKPTYDKSVSLYSISGRYVLPYTIFSYISSLKPDDTGEIQFTQALKQFAIEKELYGILHKNTRYDTGSEIGYAKAFIAQTIDKFRDDKGFIDWIRRQINS